MPTTNRRVSTLLIVTALALFGCEGVISEPGAGPDPGTGPDPGDGPGGGGDPEGIAATTRFSRLTHTQWENTVRDLLVLDGPVGLSDSFREDPTTAGFLFEDHQATLEVDQVLWSAYERAASDVAELVATDSVRLDRLRVSDAPNDARAFVEALGLRAHRRPLTSAQVDSYVSLFEEAEGLFDDMDAFSAGARLVIETMLQSPYFLYRVEPSTEQDDGVIPLDGFEIAQRLSYALWNTMPDDELFALAADGSLRDGGTVAAQADRMLDDPRAETMVADFHAQLFDVKKWSGIRPSSGAFPEVTDALPASAQQENDLFIRDVFTRGAGYLDILTSTDTFVNAELAGIYGLDGSFGDEFERVTLDASERRGVFTQIGFLAGNATSVDPDPIHRGVFVSARIACNGIGTPPDMIPPLPPPMGRTNRETVEDHTEQEGTICASCHSTVINPFGFPFEGYDAVGGFRTEDNGFPVRLDTEPPIGGQRMPVADALDLAETLAASPIVHQCYAEHWIEALLGRAIQRSDEVLVTDLGAYSIEGGSIRELLIALVTSKSFLNRSTEELP